MSTLLQKFGSLVKGVLSGFDRIVFKGSIMPLMHESGVSDFLRSKRILNKEYKAWMMEQTARIIDQSEAFSKEQTGLPITPIRSSKDRKEAIARKQQKALKITEGLIGVWSATESCMTYKARFSSTHGFPQMRREWSKCKHLYFYFDHEEYGFMHVRLQTWFPYHIQIAMNGREWLRRDLEKKNVGFERHENKILYLENYPLAQRCLDRQLNARWAAMLDGFLPVVFPSMPKILGPHLRPYWTLWQSEWATDHIFESQRALLPIGEKMKDDSPIRDLIKSACQRRTKSHRPIRALDLLGKDRVLLCTLADPRFALAGVTNRELREVLKDEPGWKGRTEKQQSAKMSRMIRLMRDHGILHKVPKRNRYRLSTQGRKLTMAICAALHASTKELVEKAA